MENYESRSVATFRLTVENFSTLNECILSSPCYVRHLPWNIKVLPWQHPDTKRKYLAFFLHCSVVEEWNFSCCATADLSILSQKDKPFSRSVAAVFYSNITQHGYADFIPWDDILDPTRGYIDDDKITLEVHLDVGEPYGSFADRNHNIIHGKNNCSLVEIYDDEEEEVKYMFIELKE